MLLLAYQQIMFMQNYPQGSEGEIRNPLVFMKMKA